EGGRAMKVEVQCQSEADRATPRDQDGNLDGLTCHDGSSPECVRSLLEARLPVAGLPRNALPVAGREPGVRVSTPSSASGRTSAGCGLRTDARLPERNRWPRGAGHA